MQTSQIDRYLRYGTTGREDVVLVAFWDAVADPGFAKGGGGADDGKLAEREPKLGSGG